MKKLLTSLLLLPLTVLAAEPALEDFAGGFEISTDGSTAIYRVPIPAEVYDTVTRADLGDVRIFNQDKQPIPFAIRRPDDRKTASTAWIEVPLFPLSGESGTSDHDKLDITVRADGAIVEIRSGGAAPVPEGAVRRYLMDLSGVQSNVDALEFTVISGEANYLKRAQLEASDDLNYWSPLVQNATLSSLQYAGHDLVKNRIDLTGIKPKYLRFTWQDEIRQIRIEGVRAVLNTVSMRRERTWSTVTGVRTEEEGRPVYSFDTGGVFPVEQVNVILPEDNTLIEGTLKSRNNEKVDWRIRESGLFYHLAMKGTHLDRGAFTVQPTTDRYWRLEVKNEDGLGSVPLQMSYAWVPNEIYFLARGRGPFILAYGNADAAAPGKPVDALMHALSDDQQSELITTAALGKPVELRGKDALKPGMKIPWQRILLWSVLVIGVLVIAIITLRLVKQMGNTA